MKSQLRVIWKLIITESSAIQIGLLADVFITILVVRLCWIVYRADIAFNENRFIF